MWEIPEDTRVPSVENRTANDRGRGRELDQKEARAARYRERRERPERPRPRKDRRSRTAAVVVLVVVALVIAIIGVTAGASLLGDDNAGDSPPFSLLPITVPPSTTSAAPVSTSASASAFTVRTVLPLRDAAASANDAVLNGAGVANDVTVSAALCAELTGDRATAADISAQGIAQTQ